MSPHLLRRLAPLLLLLAVTTLAFARLWSVELSWDDEALVRDNQWTASLDQIPELFRRDLWSTTRMSGMESGYYRPLFLVSLTLDRQLFGLSSAGAHIVSLLWHLGAVAALMALLTRLLGEARALLGATIFALHPAQSEVLALVAARNDSMAAVGVLLALMLLMDREISWARGLAAGLLALGALLCKESAALAPLMLLALDLGRWGRPGPGARYLPLGMALGLALAARALAGVSGAPGLGSGWADLGQHALELLGTYAGVLLWPWPLTPARHIHYLAPLHQTLPFLVLLGAALVAAVRLGRDRGLVLAGIAWSALTFAPTLAATLDKGLLGERYLYFPIAGLGLAIAAAISAPPRWVCAALAAPAVALLQLRLPQWQDSRAVWTAAHAAAPTPFTAAGLAWYLRRDGDLAGATPLLEEALAGDPPYRDACSLAALVHLEAHRPAEAARVGLWAIQERGCDASGPIGDHTALGLAGAGRWDEALKLAQQRPGGPSQTGVVVIAAAWARAGKLDAVTALAPRVPGPPSFPSRVAKLLRLSGETATAEAVAALDRP